MIKKTNATLQKKLLCIKNAEAVKNLIETLGYLDLDSEHYIFVGDYFNVLFLAQGISEHALQKLQAKYMSAEERQRYEMAEKKRLEVLAEMKEKQDYMKRLQEQSDCDRKEKAGEKVKASVANQLNFGANIVKFKPPCPPKGR